MSQVLNDTGVAFLPGSAFGMDPAEMYVRLAYVNFDGEPFIPSQFDFLFAHMD